MLLGRLLLPLLAGCHLFDEIVLCGADAPCAEKVGRNDDSGAEGDSAGDTSSSETGTTPRDEDEDGFESEADGGEDCDDADPTVHPGAVEACNEIDDNCDGVLDEGVATEWYLDGDGDGFGAGTPVLACEPPDDHVADGADCDDGNRFVSPAASDLCNGVDDDCDAAVDEDFDLDGDGVPGNAPCAGTLGLEADCDDARTDVYPGAPETCGDGVDNDCESGADCGPWGTVDLADAGAVLSGESGRDAAGMSVGWGDLTGDGVNDLLVGANSQEGAGSIGGAAYVVEGPLSATSGLGSAAAVLHGLTYEGVGQQIASGDVTGDGRADLVTTGCYLSGNYDGAVYVTPGPLLGASTTLESSVLSGDGYYRLACFGLTVTDVSGDGVDDILVGAPSASTTTDAGSAYLVHGPVTSSDELTAAGIELTGEASGDRFGGYDTVAADFDGDGVIDIAVSAYGVDTGAEDAGAAYLFLGRLTGAISASSADAKLTGDDAGDWAGWSLAAGDVDGDGRANLLVGAPYDDTSGTDAGSTYSFLAVPSGTVTLGRADVQLTGSGPSELAGYNVAAGDVDGDGVDDSLVSGLGSGADLSAGVVHLVLGPLAGGAYDLAGADGILVGENPEDTAGFWGLAAGDLDDDGFADIMLGAPGLDGGGDYSGGAYLLYGGPGL